MITSTANKQVKWVRSLQTRRRARQQEGLFVIEGARLLEEAFHAERILQLVFYTPEWGEKHPHLIPPLQESGAQIEVVTEPIMAKCSDVENPQGVLAVLPQGQTRQEGQSDPTLILDRLSDPGNLGTILRTALAAEAWTVYLTQGSVDVYNPKVVRAAMGAHFYLDIIEATVDQILMRIGDLSLWVAEARMGELYHRVDWRNPIALAIGSEARGLHTDLLARASGQVQIPIASQSESLNAAIAAAVILFEIQRQRRE
jgi:TrmH family RNA methyltransferase